jgi:hypothetical protein
MITSLSEHQKYTYVSFIYYANRCWRILLLKADNFSASQERPIYLETGTSLLVYFLQIFFSHDIYIYSRSMLSLAMTDEASHPHWTAVQIVLLYVLMIAFEQIIIYYFTYLLLLYHMVSIIYHFTDDRLLGRVFSSSQGLYLSTGNTNTINIYAYQTSMPFVGFEPRYRFPSERREYMPETARLP